MLHKTKHMLHKMENIRCTKQKIYAAQKGKYTLYKNTKENIRYVTLHKKNTSYKKRKMEHTSGLHTFPLRLYPIICAKCSQGGNAV